MTYTKKNTAINNLLSKKIFWHKLFILKIPKFCIIQLKAMKFLFAKLWL